MSYYVIEGGKPLKGRVRVAGAKNAATKQIVASLLTGEDVVLSNVPRIGDTDVTLNVCKSIGLKYKWQDTTTLKLSTPQILTPEVPLAFSGLNRIPILLLGPLLHRYGKAVIPMLGGCNIGERPVDFHVQALEKLGAKIVYQEGRYYAVADKLQGTMLELPYPSVGATENILLSSVLAQGRTVIKNAAIEPEVIDLVMMLQKMGAIIFVDTARTIEIEGVDELHGASHTVINDRIEAASFAVAGVITGGDVIVEGAEQHHMLTFLNKLRQVGANFEVLDKAIRFYHPGGALKPIALETDVHPGFMTDWQQPMVMLMTQIEGLSVVHETVYEKRFGYTEDLKRMGAEIQLYKTCLGEKACRFKSLDHAHSCVIKGSTPLHAADITIPDLRAGFSYLIAAAVAKGVSKVRGIQYVERGYSNILSKFQSLDANMRLVEE
ncbi:UDP-N-acetylglucosamine 1-carboxyvinyltransferase [Candidatus Chlorohelix sp.]|uniref:UDP-N-acetylglucosamine 1-carboxyvinyltransferase n=1 Tax=Candidatus Chlorohelix sp. TaxID=3139201 RepID=UPI00302F8AE5